MDLLEILNGGELKQDDWTLTRPRIGEHNQIEIVGYVSPWKVSKLYVMKCAICCKDSELHGDGYFKSVKSSITRGSLPCGCSKPVFWTKEQYTIICSRKATELGYEFIGFIGAWRGSNTNTSLLCEKHGEWTSGVVRHLISKGVGCPGCAQDIRDKAASPGRSKPDDTMIASFFASGGFHPDTVFWKSDRKTRKGCLSYWYMSCPDCGSVGEAVSGNLQTGGRPCLCSPQRQKEAYINWVIDTDKIIAIKFGIARDSRLRLRQQNSRSIYDIEQHSVYLFNSKYECRKAERECKQELECAILPKEEIPDGWTETTWVYNLDKIVEIYERNGGVKK